MRFLDGLRGNSRKPAASQPKRLQTLRGRTARLIERTLNDIHQALARAGVEFTNGGQPGVKMKPWQRGDEVQLAGRRNGTQPHSELLQKRLP